MCGIFWIATLDVESVNHQITEALIVLRHRGPDGCGCNVEVGRPGTRAVGAGHVRLAIVHPEMGAQPIIFVNDVTHKKGVLTINGEIYNHMELRIALYAGMPPEHDKYVRAVAGQGTDCDIILRLYMHLELTSFIEALRDIDGPFAFALSEFAYPDEKFSPDATGQCVRAVFARDRMGINPLYFLMDSASSEMLAVASEAKALMSLKKSAPEKYVFGEFPPGVAYLRFAYGAGKWLQYYSIRELCAQPTFLYTKSDAQAAADAVRAKLIEAVAKRVSRDCLDVPFGAFLSGGLDSSIIVAIVAKQLADEGRPPLRTFSIGLSPESPDIIAAQQVADALGTIHTNFFFTVDEGMSVIERVIYHVETYDITTVRASVPLYILCSRIAERHPEIKVLLSGEGSDEIFGGYLYFHHAPNATALHEEITDKMAMLYQYDVRRLNKTCAAFGLEARVPFLDNEFLEVALRDICPTLKLIDASDPECSIEKWLLRKAFRGYGNLPDFVIDRQKEQFSDGVGYEWIDALRANGTEASRYRSIFERLFSDCPDVLSLVPEDAWQSVACSTPRAVLWVSSVMDPSGRSISAVHRLTASKTGQ